METKSMLYFNSIDRIGDNLVLFREKNQIEKEKDLHKGFDFQYLLRGGSRQVTTCDETEAKNTPFLFLRTLQKYILLNRLGAAANLAVAPTLNQMASYLISFSQIFLSVIFVGIHCSDPCGGFLFFTAQTALTTSATLWHAFQLYKMVDWLLTALDERDFISAFPHILCLCLHFGLALAFMYMGYEEDEERRPSELAAKDTYHRKMLSVFSMVSGMVILFVWWCFPCRYQKVADIPLILSSILGGHIMQAESDIMKATKITRQNEEAPKIIDDNTLNAAIGSTKIDAALAKKIQEQTLEFDSELIKQDWLKQIVQYYYDDKKEATDDNTVGATVSKAQNFITALQLAEDAQSLYTPDEIILFKNKVHAERLFAAINLSSKIETRPNQNNDNQLFYDKDNRYSNSIYTGNASDKLDKLLSKTLELWRTTSNEMYSQVSLEWFCKKSNRDMVFESHPLFIYIHEMTRFCNQELPSIKHKNIYECTKQEIKDIVQKHPSFQIKNIRQYTTEILNKIDVHCKEKVSDLFEIKIDEIENIGKWDENSTNEHLLTLLPECLKGDKLLITNKDAIYSIFDFDGKKLCNTSRKEFQVAIINGTDIIKLRGPAAKLYRNLLSRKKTNKKTNEDPDFLKAYRKTLHFLRKMQERNFQLYTQLLGDDDEKSEKKNDEETDPLQSDLDIVKTITKRIDNLVMPVHLLEEDAHNNSDWNEKRTVELCAQFRSLKTLGKWQPPSLIGTTDAQILWFVWNKLPRRQCNISYLWNRLRKDHQVGDLLRGSNWYIHTESEQPFDDEDYSVANLRSTIENEYSKYQSDIPPLPIPEKLKDWTNDHVIFVLKEIKVDLSDSGKEILKGITGNLIANCAGSLPHNQQKRISPQLKNALKEIYLKMIELNCV